MPDRRRANRNWYVADEKGDLHGNMRDGVSVAVLMDIRDELQKLNALLACPNFTSIPTILRTIRRNTAGLRKPAAKKAGRK
jgi:hypothetical protein